MQKQLDEAVEKFKNSQTTLEAYEAISDFVKIIETSSEFIEKVETEGENIRIKQIKLNADKSWDCGLRGKDLKEHNEYRDRKGEALHQLNLVFPLRNLNNVRLGIQPENIADNSDWLFRWTKPDEPMRESDRKEYQGFIDKLYKKLISFLEKEDVKEITKEIIPLEKKETKVKSYDEEKRILSIGNYQIKIAKNEGNNNSHEIMAYIFIDKKDDLTAKFYYSDIAEQRFEAEYDAEDKNAQQPYSGACKRINQTIKDETNSEVKEFLIFNHSKLGYVKINPIYL